MSHGNEKCRFNWAAFLFAGVFSYYRKSQDIFWQHYKWPFIIYAAIMLGISGSGFLAAKSEAGIAGWLIAAYVLTLAINIYLLIIKYSKDSLKFLSKLDKKSVARIRAAIQDLTLTPPKGDIKVMQGYNDDRKRLRVGSWRIIYKYGVDNEIDILFIIDIGNRGDIYK